MNCWVTSRDLILGDPLDILGPPVLSLNRRRALFGQARISNVFLFLGLKPVDLFGHFAGTNNQQARSRGSSVPACPIFLIFNR